ncbi:uncharacterized protein LODBEIA_P58860 [Lodderomyces beijingensis]|uniref:Trafficking protein particle complex subunit 6B n=1 Tax=Lodderomyces beijingensis TaxID=1775926 RepID=A0ABP0ZVP0_9ASCO
MSEDFLDQQSQINAKSLHYLLQELVPASIRVSEQLRNAANGTPATEDIQTRIDSELSPVKDDQPGTINVFNARYLHSDETTIRIETYGYTLGLKLAEILLYKNSNKSKMVDILDIMKFVCRDVWKLMYDKQMDNLRTNHRGTFVLVDNDYRLINRLNSAKGESDTLEKAKLYMWFPCGVIRGILMSFGVEANVVGEITSFPGVVFNIHTSINN